MRIICKSVIRKRAVTNIEKRVSKLALALFCSRLCDADVRVALGTHDFADRYDIDIILLNVFI
jgi:hypothetical protein